MPKQGCLVRLKLDCTLLAFQVASLLSYQLSDQRPGPARIPGL